MPDTPEQLLNEVEQIRQQNIRRQQALLAALYESQEFLDTQIALQEINSNSRSVERTKRGNKKSRKLKQKSSVYKDNTFRFSGYVPTERRRSARLENKDPEFSVEDLLQDGEIIGNLADLEKVTSRPKPKVKRLHSFKKREVARVTLDVEDVTEEMIRNVCKNVKDKKYSENGTSCHQCRQKTLDQKTVCRSKDCQGIRGQVCGVCARNRYGENVQEALKDPNWHCYVCRDICNCSFCRNKEGKRPTGVLAPTAARTGYPSVRHFLDSLNGVGDFPSEDNQTGDSPSDDNMNTRASKKREAMKNTDAETEASKNTHAETEVSKNNDALKETKTSKDTEAMKTTDVKTETSKETKASKGTDAMIEDFKRMSTSLKNFVEDINPDNKEDLIGFINQGSQAVLANGSLIDVGCDLKKNKAEGPSSNSSAAKDSFLHSLGVSRIKRITGLRSLKSSKEEQMRMKLINSDLDEVLEYLNEKDGDDGPKQPEPDSDEEVLGFDMDGNVTFPHRKWDSDDDDNNGFRGFFTNDTHCDCCNKEIVSFRF